MVKRQRLLQFTITLLLILALTVGIIFATGIDWGVKGGDVIEGGGSTGVAPSAPFVDMPANTTDYVNVMSTKIEAAKKLTDKDFKADKDGALLVETAEQFINIFTRSLPEKTYRLANNFIIGDLTFLSTSQLSLTGRATIDGNNKNVITTYIASPTPLETENENFGGFLQMIDANSTIKNLNYFLDPHAMVMVANNEHFGQKPANSARWGIHNVNVGGFVGLVQGTIENCNINIYGTVYALRMHPTGEKHPYAGGAFGQLQGTLKNSVVNVVGATVSASSQVTEDDETKLNIRLETEIVFRRGLVVAGGIAGALNGSHLIGNVFNVTPSTIVGKDLLGLVTGKSDADHVFIGTYFGKLENTTLGDTTNYDGNVFVDYNGLTNPSDKTGNLTLWKKPRATGDGYDVAAAATGAVHMKVDLASFYGDDIKFGVDIADVDAHKNGKQYIYINERYLTTPATLTGFVASGLGTEWKKHTLSDHGIAGNKIEFREGAGEALVVKDSHDWNRLVSLSGTAYYTDNIYSTDSPVLDPLVNIATKNTLITTRENVVLDTANAPNGELILDSKAAPAFALYAHIAGNNKSGTNAEDNILNTSLMTRNSGIVHQFRQNSAGNAGFHNLTIENKAGIQDGAAVRKYVGGLVDHVGDGVVFERCVINNDFTYSKNGVNNATMLSIAATKGALYFGGVFGYIGGKLENCIINSTTSITNDLLRYGGDTGKKIYHNTVHIGGFAAFTKNLELNNVILNVTDRLLKTLTTHKSLIGGLIARADEKITITNSQVSVQLLAASGGEEVKKNDSNAVNSSRSGQSVLAGLIAEFTTNSNDYSAAPMDVTDTRLSIAVSAKYTESSVNSTQAYMFGRVSGVKNSTTIPVDEAHPAPKDGSPQNPQYSDITNLNSKHFNFTNVAINMNNTWGLGCADDGDQAINTNELWYNPALTLFSNVGTWTNNNVWLYNAGDRAVKFTSRDVAKGTFNTISTKGATLGEGSQQILLKDVHALAKKPDGTNRPLNEVVDILSSVTNLDGTPKAGTGNYTYANAMAKFNFKVEPSTSFYDMRRLDKTYRQYYVGDEIKNRPELIPVGDDGIRTYTGANITWNGAIEQKSPLTEAVNNGVHAGLGWFNGSGAIGTKLTSAEYTATVEPIFAKNNEGQLLIDKTNGECHVVAEYTYTLTVPAVTSAGTKQHITALLSTSDIKDAAEWNQVAKNVNSGITHKDIPVRLVNNIFSTDVNKALLSIGYDATHAFEGVFEGIELKTMVPNPAYNADVAVSESNPKEIEKVAGYPVITVANIQGAGGGTAGLFGYVPAATTIKNFSVKGAQLWISPSDVKAANLTIDQYPYYNMGIIAGDNRGTITNINVIAGDPIQQQFTTPQDVRYGLLVGYNKGTIESCTVSTEDGKKPSLKVSNNAPNINTGASNPTIYVGGLVGYMDGGTVSKTIANLSQYTFSQADASVNNIYISAGFGYVNNGSVNDAYISVQSSTRDASISNNRYTSAGFVKNSTLFNSFNVVVAKPISDNINRPDVIHTTNTVAKTRTIVMDATDEIRDMTEIVFEMNGNDVKVSVVNADSFAVAGYISRGSYITFNPVLSANISQISDVRIVLINSDINDVGTWNRLADNVMKGATFDGYTFNIKANLTFDNAHKPTPIGQYDKATLYEFQGIINGNGNTITLDNLTYNSTYHYNALIGALGEKGAFINTNIVVKGAYSNEDAVSGAALVVGNNRGRIENINVSLNEVTSMKITADKAAIFAAHNTGVITMSNILTKLDLQSTEALVNITGNDAGMLAGVSESETLPSGTVLNGAISGIDVVTASVKVLGSNNNANVGMLVGSNLGKASMNSIVNELKGNHAYSGANYFNNDADYFVGNISETSDIKNVWILLNDSQRAIDDAPGVDYVSKHPGAKLRYRDDIFNVMYNYSLNGNTGSIDATVSSKDVVFNVSPDYGCYFYGYVSDFDHAVTDNPYISISLKDTVGTHYAAVFAKTNISTYEDLTDLTRYIVDPSDRSNGGRIINGIVFTIDDNTRIEFSTTEPLAHKQGPGSESRIKWDRIEEFNYVLRGGQGSVIATDSTIPIKANYIFDGLFGTITKSGGIENITFEMTGSVGVANDKVVPEQVTPTNAGFLARENYGVISNVNFVSTGKVVANSANGAAGILVGANYGTIETVNVSMVKNATYNDTVSPLVTAHYAGLIAGTNAGLIKESTAKIGADTMLAGNTVGVLVGKNTETGIIDDKGEIIASVIDGGMQGIHMGGIAGENDGVINSINVIVNKWIARSVELNGKTIEFGGITAINRGLIAGVHVYMNADSTVAKLDRVAGIAVASIGTITSTTLKGVSNANIVDITAPMVANNIAAGAVVVTETDGVSSTIDAVKIPNILFGLQINIRSDIKASNAVGFIYKNSAKVNNIFININGNIIGTDLASMLGNEVSETSTQPAKLVNYTDNKALETPQYEINNNHVIIMGAICPQVTSPLGNVTATYMVDNGVKYTDAWLIRKNNYHVDRGNIGLNEYKHIADGVPELSKEELKQGKLVIVSNSGGGAAKVFLRTEADGTGDVVVAAGTRNAYNPGIGNQNKTVIFSQYILDINANNEAGSRDTELGEGATDFIKISDNMKEHDLFYDVTINLNVKKIDIVDAFLFAPFGSFHEFNSTFNGHGNTINLLSDVATTRSGLFGTIGKAGAVNNLIVNVGDATHSVEIGKKSSEYAGGLAGQIYGAVNNVAVKIYNTPDEATNPVIAADKMSGAFAGSIENTAVLNNAWIFMQGGRYAPANGAKSLNPSLAKNNTYNVVNLGGTLDVDIDMVYAESSSDKSVTNATFRISIDSNYLDDDGLDNMNDVDWKSEVNSVVSGITMQNYSADPSNKTLPSIFAMPYSSVDPVQNTRYSVSLIKNKIESIDDLVELSKSQSGFNISKDEVFELATDLVLSASDLDKGKFYAIGSSTANRDFKSTFNGNGYTITFGSDVEITETNGELAGLFGRIGASANINNLKVVVNTSKYTTTRFAGGLAGNNKSHNLNNIIVEINSNIDVSRVNFGGIFGDIDDGLDIKGVYLVKDYEQDPTKDFAPTAKNNLQGNFNVITRYRTKEKNGGYRENITFKIAPSTNTLTITDGTSYANYYGVIRTSSDQPVIVDQSIGKPNVSKTEWKGVNTLQGETFAAVFVNTSITDKASYEQMVADIDNGFNVRWLEYSLDSDFEVSGTLKDYATIHAASSTVQDAFKATFNGNGNTIKLRNVTVLGQNAGLFGVIHEIGIVKNVIIDVANVTVGHGRDDANLIVGTEMAGVLAAVNEGKILNSVVYDNSTGDKNDKGIRFVGTGNMVVAKNTRTLANVWLVQNNKNTKTTVDKAVGIMNLVGYDIALFDFGVMPEADAEGIQRIVAYMPMDAYIYNMTDMSKNINEVPSPASGISNMNITFPAYDKNAPNSKFVLSDFSLVINNGSEFSTFVDTVNNGNTSFYGVEVSLAKKIVLGTGEEDPLATPALFNTIGTKARPFDGIFNGNMNKIEIMNNVKVYGDMYAGIFGNVSVGAVIKNVEFLMSGDIYVTPIADTSNPEHVTYSDVYAGIIAHNRGKIENVIMMANRTMDIIVNDANINYKGNKVIAGGVAYTTEALYNTWYIRTTETSLAPSTTKTQISNINTMSIVGKVDPATDPIMTGISLNSATQSVEVTFTANNGGVFYEDYNNASAAAQSLASPLKLGVKKSSVYELVNYTAKDDGYAIASADDFAQLAQDTRGGYSFNERKFYLSPIEITATSEYSLGTFGGVIIPVDKTAVPDITIVNNIVTEQIIDKEAGTSIEVVSVKNDTDFVLIDTLGKTGKLDNVIIDIGTSISPLEMVVSSGQDRKPKAIIVNNNNGIISGGRIVANVVTYKQAKDFAIVVGTNNDTITGLDLTVSTKDPNYDSAVSAELAPAIRANSRYGHLAVVNNKNISSVNVHAVEAKVLAYSDKVGYFGYVVAENSSNAGTQALMTDVTLDIGDKSTITASKKHTNTYSAGLAGLNKGIVERSAVVFNGLPDTKSYFIDSYYASFLIGTNDNGYANDLYVDATHDISDAIYFDGTSTPSDRQVAGYLKSYNTNAAIDMNYGWTARKNITVLMDDSDPSLAKKEINTKFANVIVVTGVGHIKIDTKVNNKPDAEYRPYYLFTAEEQAGSEFNGWFNYGDNVDINANNPAFAPETLNGRYEVVFYQTLIENEKAWNDMAKLVNADKNVENVVFRLGNDITLTKPVVIGTEKVPYLHGKIDGEGFSVTIAGNIDADYAGLFGYVNGAIIANLDVVVDTGVIINGTKAAGAIVGKAIGNTVIAPGDFTGTDFDVQAKGLSPSDDRKLMDVTINGTITSDGQNTATTGGAVGDMSNGIFRYVRVTNNGIITASEQADTYAGGIIGVDADTDVAAITLVNNGEIRANIAGGLVGSHTSTHIIDQFSVDSYTENAKIVGKFAGAAIGKLAGNMQFGMVKYANNDPEAQNTKALVPNITGTNYVQNTWIITTPKVGVLNTSVTTLGKANNSIRVLRAANVDFIKNAVNETGTTGVVFSSDVTNDGTFDYWSFTTPLEDGTTIYDNVVNPNTQKYEWFTPNGIKATKLDTDFSNIDITLEKINNITTVDQIKGLAYFAHNTGAIVRSDDLKAQNQTITITLGKSLDITGIALPTVKPLATFDRLDTIDLLGCTLDGMGKSILTIDNKTSISNGTLDNMVIAIKTGANDQNVVINNKSGKVLTLENVALANSDVYTEDTIPTRENSATQFMTKFGSFDMGSIKPRDKVAIMGGVRFVTRDYAKKGQPQTKVIIGNVPLYVDESGNIVGYTKKPSEYGHYDSAVQDGVSYYFVKFIGYRKDNPSVDNKDKALAEIDYLLKKGYTFAGKTIGVHMNLNIASPVEPKPLALLGAPEQPTEKPTDFLGTFDGQGHTITFNEGYVPLFASIGEQGLITNFIVDVAPDGTTPVFESGAGDDLGGMKNIIILNKSDLNYPEFAAGFTYDQVVVIQGENAGANNEFKNTHGYKEIFALNVNTAVNGDISQIVDIKDVAIKTMDYLAIQDVDFRITSNISNANPDYMFAGFYYNFPASTGGKLTIVDPFREGIRLNDLHETDTYKFMFGHEFYMNIMSAVISSEAGWNSLVQNLPNIDTHNDTIKIGTPDTKEIVLGAGVTGAISSGALRGATIDGQNNRIKLTAEYADRFVGQTDADLSLFNDYKGTIKNLVIDARESGLTGTALVKAIGATKFENVIIIVTADAVASDPELIAEVETNPLLTLIIGNGVTFTYDENDSKKLTFDCLTLDSILHITDEARKAVPVEGATVYAKYGTLDLGVKTDHNVFIVEKVSEINNIEQLKSAKYAEADVTATNAAGAINLKFAPGDLVIGESIELKNLDDNTTINIDANGGRMVVVKGATLDINGFNISNVIINGIGNVKVNAGTVDTAIITANLSAEAATGSRTYTNVWVNTNAENKNNDVYELDLSGAYDAGRELFDIRFVPGVPGTLDTTDKFTITFNDSANRYFVGMTTDQGVTYVAGENATTQYDLVDDGNTSDNPRMRFDYISNEIKDIPAVGVAETKSALSVYNDMVATVNKSPLLEGKTFYVVGKLVANVADGAATPFDALDKPIVLDGNKAGANDGRLQSIRLNELQVDALKNVTINNMVVEILNKGAGTLAATVGKDVVIITNDTAEAFPITAAQGSTVVRVMNYDRPDNTFVYDNINGVITYTTTSNTSFYARDLGVERAVGDAFEKGIVKSRDISDLLAEANKSTAGYAVNIKFYLPVDVTANNATDDVISGIIDTKDNIFPREVEYNENTLDINKDTGSKKVDIPANLKNIVIYSITGGSAAGNNGLDSLVGTGADRKITCEIVGDKAIVVKLGIDIIREKSISNISEEYSLDAFDPANNPYKTVSLRDIVSYTIRPGMSCDFAADDVLKNATTRPDVKRDADGKVIGYNRVIEFTMAGKVVGEIHYTHTIKPYSIGANDIRMKDVEYVNDGSMVGTPDTETLEDAKGNKTLLGKLDEVTRADVIQSLTGVTYKYANYSVGEQDVKVNGGFSKDNFELANGTVLKGKINKRKITINVDSFFNDTVFDHTVTGNSIYRGITFDVIRANATVNGGEPLGTIGTDGVFVANAGMDKYMPSKAFEMAYRDASADTYFYVENYSGRILDVRYDALDNVIAHNVVFNIADSDYYEYEVEGIDKAVGDYTIEDRQTVNRAIYNITMTDNTVGYGKHYLTNINLSDTNFNNIIYQSVDEAGEPIPLAGLGVTMDYLMWDEVSKVVNGTRVFTELGTHNIVGALNTVVVSTSTTVIPRENYEIKGNISGNAITGGQFVVDDADIYIDLSNTSKKIKFSGRTPKPNISLKWADAYSNAGLTSEIEYLDKDGNVITKDRLSSEVVKVGTYKIAIRVKSAVTGDYVTEHINNTNKSQNIVDDTTSFITSFEIVQTDASAYMNAVKKPIVATYGDAVQDVKSFMYFVSTDIDALIGGKSPVFDVQLTMKDKDGNEVTYTDKLPVGKYTVEYDPAKNAELEANAHVVMKGGKIANLDIQKREVNINLTVKGDKTITYGDVFKGHDIVYSIDNVNAKPNEDGTIPQIDWMSYIDPTTFIVEYKKNDKGEAAIVENETIFNAGIRAFTEDEFTIKPDANHKIGKVTIESIEVLPKKVVATLSDDANATKYYGQAGDVQWTLDSYILLDGVPTTGVMAKYTYADVIGAQDVTLVDLANPNYIMTNASPVYKGILTVNKTPYKAKVKTITYNEKVNNTTIIVKAEVGDGESDKCTIVVDGIVEKEEDLKKIVNDYLVQNKGITSDLYDLTLNKTLPEANVTDEFKPIVPYIVLGVIGLCVLIALGLIIGSTVTVHNMPSGFNKDFNFSRDPGKKDTDNLMKAVGKRRSKEYKAAAKQMKKAAKKGTYYNVEEAIFPEASGDITSDEGDDE